MNNLLLITNKNLFRGSIVPKKGYKLKKQGGRNNTGKITTRYIGGGFKTLLNKTEAKSKGQLESVNLNSFTNSYSA